MPREGRDWREPSHPRHLVAACAYCAETFWEHVGTAMAPQRRGARLRRVRANMKEHLRFHHSDRLKPEADPSDLQSSTRTP